MTTLDPILMVPLQKCDRCHTPRLLLGRTCKGKLCAPCWRELGEPPPATPSMEERNAALERMRQADATAVAAKAAASRRTDTA